MKIDEQEMQECIDRQKIIETQSKYAIFGDYTDIEKFLEIFTDDIVISWDEVGININGKKDLEEFVKATKASWGPIHHWQGNHVIELRGDLAEAKCELLLVESHPEGNRVIVVGRYDTTLVRTKKQWLIKKRLVSAFNPQLTTEAHPLTDGRF